MHGSYISCLVPTANANISSSLRRRLTFNNYNAAIMFISGSNILFLWLKNLSIVCMHAVILSLRLKLISSRRRIIEAIAKFCYFAYALTHRQRMQFGSAISNYYFHFTTSSRNIYTRLSTRVREKKRYWIEFQETLHAGDFPLASQCTHSLFRLICECVSSYIQMSIGSLEKSDFWF